MILHQIKKDRLQSRKNRDTLKATLLTTLVGEAENIAKGSGKECDMIQLITKFIKALDQTITICSKDPLLLKLEKDFDIPLNPALESLLQEKAILEAYLPTKMDEETLTKVILNQIEIKESASLPVNLGSIMMDLKHIHPNQYDGKMASVITKKLLGI